jgi:hypothetical protein
MVERRLAMSPALSGPLAGLAGQLLLLAVLAASSGLDAAGWIVGTASALAIDLALARGLAREPRWRWGLPPWRWLHRAARERRR